MSCLKRSGLPADPDRNITWWRADRRQAYWMRKAGSASPIPHLGMTIMMQDYRSISLICWPYKLVSMWQRLVCGEDWVSIIPSYPSVLTERMKAGESILPPVCLCWDLKMETTHKVVTVIWILWISFYKESL